MNVTYKYIEKDGTHTYNYYFVDNIIQDPVQTVLIMGKDELVRLKTANIIGLAVKEDPDTLIF